MSLEIDLLRGDLMAARDAAYSNRLRADNAENRSRILENLLQKCANHLGFEFPRGAGDLEAYVTISKKLVSEIRGVLP